MIVILLGPPGAGKGTHAGPLGTYLGIPHISTGDLFRENISKQTALGKKAKIYMDQGNLVPDTLVLEMLFNRTVQEDCREGYILDGCPRTVVQAKALDAQVGVSHHLIVLNFNIPDRLLVERITGRLACKGCKKIFHIKNDPPKQKGICDSCGSPLVQRTDDREDVLRTRLEVYREETEPLVHYYAQKKGILREIDSSLPKAQVFDAILEAVPQASSVN